MTAQETGYRGPDQARGLPHTDLPWEPEIFDLVQRLYGQAETAKASALGRLANQAELASRVLTLETPANLPTPISEMVSGIKLKYQQVLCKLLTVSLVSCPEELFPRQGHRRDINLPSPEEVSGTLSELAEFGLIVTLIESGRLKFLPEKMLLLERLFTLGRKDKEFFWAASSYGQEYGDVLREISDSLGIEEEDLPFFPRGLSVFSWNRKIPHFGQVLFSSSGSQGRTRAEKEEIAGLREKLLPANSIYEDDLGISRGWGFAVLATGKEGISSRFLFGFSCESNGKVLARARLPKTEKLLEDLSEGESGPVPSIAGIELNKEIFRNKYLLREKIMRFFAKIPRIRAGEREPVR